MTDTVIKQSMLPGFNVLLMGPAGTGKTHSIGTLVDAGLEVFCVFLEAGQESLFGYWTDKGKPIPDNLHWHQIAAPKASWGAMIESAKRVNTMSLETLSKVVDPDRRLHDQLEKFLTCMNNFQDDRTGQSYGSVDTWNTDRVLVIDGMAGLGRAAMANVIGGKPVKSIADWGIAQDQVERIIRKLCEDHDCHFVLISHVEREKDEVLGGIKLMVSTLGAKLAPKLPTLFSDVILTVRDGTKYVWDTANPQADLKTRNLTHSQNIKPDFGAIVAKWKSRGGSAMTTEPKKI